MCIILYVDNDINVVYLIRDIYHIDIYIGIFIMGLLRIFWICFIGFLVVFYEVVDEEVVFDVEFSVVKV